MPQHGNFNALLPIERRLAFERTISKISSRFVMNPGDLNDAIQISLEEMGRLSGASRAYIFEFQEGYAYMDNTHEWCAEGVSPEKPNLQSLPTEMFPWWMNKLHHNELIIIPEVALLPEEAAAERDILEAQAIKSLVVLPIHVSDRLFGYIGFDNVRDSGPWHSDDLLVLRLASEIFGSAFTRLRFEAQLIDTNRRLQENLDEIRKLQSQLVQQERLVGIGQLAAGIAHELNNPLGFIISNYETLTQHTHKLARFVPEIRRTLAHVALDDPAVAALVAELERQRLAENLADMADILEDSRLGFTRVSEIITSLRNFAHTNPQGDLEYENLHQLADEVLIIVNNELKYCAEVIRDYEPLPLVCCHRGQISQVLINLVMNGVQAIRAKWQGTYGHLRLRIWQEGLFACVAVADDGVGIEPSALPFIFNPFYTTKPIGEGTGLGLSISYDLIVNKHKGSMDVESAPGEGTCFTLRLPIGGN